MVSYSWNMLWTCLHYVITENTHLNLFTLSNAMPPYQDKSPSLLFTAINQIMATATRHSLHFLLYLSITPLFLCDMPALLYIALRSMRVVGRLPAQTTDVLNLKDTQSLNSWQFTCRATQSDWIHSRKGGWLEGFLSKGLYLTNLKRVTQWVMQTTWSALLWYRPNALQVFLRTEQREILE